MMLIYQIQEGDTGDKIACNAGVSRDALAFVNQHMFQRICIGTALPIDEFLHIPVVLNKGDLRKLRNAFKDK